jgi:Putative zincin peptidase
MRFHLGAIPNSPDFAPDASWSSLREPSPWLAQLIALPIGVVAAATLAVFWFLVTPLGHVTPTISVSAFFLSFAGIVVVHELIHALGHPMAGRSSHSILGFWPSRVLFYAHYDGELSRNRFIAILLMPLVIISIVPLLVAAVIQVTSGWAAFISAFNALLACGDMLGAGMVLFQIPATRIVRNQGWRTYWRKHESHAA